MKRVLAVAVACLLMAGALLVRNAITDDDADGDGNNGTEPGEDDDLVVACIPELADACEALERQVTELRIEDPGDTIAASADVDAWVTLDPWPEMAGTQRLRNADAVATDELVVIARDVPAALLCGPVTWTCLVDTLASDQVAVPDPSTASGRLVLGHAAVDLFGRDLAANDFDDPDFSRRLRRVGVSSDPLDDIRIGLPEPLATGAFALDAARLGSRPVRTGPGRSPATVAVVVAGPGRDRIATKSAFITALADLGWTIDPTAATTGLPRAGVLVALAEEVA